jgi:DNA-binding response OmpR family regulator
MDASGRSGRILVVDDDRRFCSFLTRFLAREGYSASAAHDGQAMRRALADHEFVLVLLDLSFPSGDDGIGLARRLRREKDVPLIMLSGKTSTMDKVVSLELGADDYVTKPFEPRELLARIRAVLRRSARQVEVSESDQGGASIIRFAGWRLDLDRRTLLAPDSRPVTLTSMEFDLLSALARRRGRVLTREQVVDIVASRRWSPADRSVDMLISKTRRKLRDVPGEAAIIKTVRGVGYVFTPTA